MTDSDTARAINDPAAVRRDNHDTGSWQRTALGTGASSRDYYDRAIAEAANEPKSAPPGAVGHAVKVVGVVIALAGLAAWLWLILALLSAVGAGNLPDDAFGTRFLGIPLGRTGFDAILIGGLLALGGGWAERAARRRVHWEHDDTPE